MDSTFLAENRSRFRHVKSLPNPQNLPNYPSVPPYLVRAISAESLNICPRAASGGYRGSRPAVKEPDNRHRRLLRARCRAAMPPRRRAAEERDELALVLVAALGI